MDINRRLLVLVLVFLVILTSFTIYYESTLRELRNEYNKYKGEYSAITANIAFESMKRNPTPDAAINAEFLESAYTELSALNEELRKKIDALESKLLLIKSQIEYQKAKDIGPTENFRLVQNKNKEIRELKEKIQEICGVLNANNVSYYACK